MSNALTLVDVNGEPRIRDIELGERLGFERPRKIRDLIKANEAKLLKFGVCPAAGQTSGPLGGRPAQEYFLNQKQAIFICMKSETDKAFEVQADIVRVYDAHVQGVQHPTLLTVPEMLLKQAEVLVSHDRQLTDHAKRLDRLEEIATTQVADPAPITRGNPRRPIKRPNGLMTATQLGSHFGMSARQMNSYLVDIGLMIEMITKQRQRFYYQLTTLGKAYGVPLHTNGEIIPEGSTSMGAKRTRTIVWMPEVISFVAEKRALELG